MKIAIWHNLPSGGGKRALYYHVRGLVERGHEIVSWSLDTADHVYLPLSELVPEHVLPYERGRQPRRRFIGRFGRGSSIDRLRTFDEACQRCAREIEAGGFDLLFANSTVMYSMPYIIRHVRIPKVLYLQEPCRYLYEASPILPWVSDAPDLNQAKGLRPRRFITDYRLQTLRTQAKQEWLNAQACDFLLVNSYYSRESILRAYGVDAKVCYLGVDTKLFRNLELEREPFVVGLGSFDYIKGIDLAVKPMALVPEPRPPLVWIANSGDERYQSEVIELARSLGVDLQIKNAIPDAELVTTLNRATLLLYTSRLEPFGFAPLEANACGLPVVAVAEGGVRETVQDGVNGFLADRDPENIAGAINRLLQNPALARQMGENGALHVQGTWNVERSVDRLEAFLLRAVAEKSQPSA